MQRMHRRTCTLITIGILFAVNGPLAQEVDIAISDVRVIESGPEAGRLFAPVRDKSGRFDTWFDDQVQKRRDAGEDPAPDTIYTYRYEVWVDDIRRAEGTSYLPRSGRDWLQIEGFRLPEDALEHDLVMEIEPDAGLPDADDENNIYKTVLLFGTPRTVTITLMSLDVHDDCDNFSPGDWQVGLAAYRGTPDPGNGVPRDRPSVGLLFPSATDTRNMSSGETETVNRSVELTGVGTNETINVFVNALDCDSEIAPRLDKLGLGRECRGEEFWEAIAGGDHDFAGALTVTLGPDEWPGATTLSADVPFDQDHDCGDSAHIGAELGRAFTANLRFDVRDE